MQTEAGITDEVRATERSALQTRCSPLREDATKRPREENAGFYFSKNGEMRLRHDPIQVFAEEEAPSGTSSHARDICSASAVHRGRRA
jgi:hypothetical protein